jgi:hypothetical protein
MTPTDNQAAAVPTPFTITGWLGSGLCTAAFDAAAAHLSDEQTHALRDEVWQDWPGATDRVETSVRDILTRDSRTENGDGTYTTALTAHDTTASSCDCGEHAWLRLAAELDTLLHGLDSPGWAREHGDQLISDVTGRLDRSIVSAQDEADEYIPFTVTWDGAVVTVTRDAGSGTQTLRPLTGARADAWHAWKARESWPNSARGQGYEYAAREILATGEQTLAVVPALYDTIIAAGAHRAYRQVLIAARAAGLTTVTPTDLEYLRGLADGWDGKVTDLVTAMVELQATGRH